MSNKLISIDDLSKKAAKQINNRYKARQAFWDVALGNNTKLANLAKLAIMEAENEAQQRKPLTFEQVEDCFGDGATTEENGILVSAQWLHDFARAIEAAHGIKE